MRRTSSGLSCENAFDQSRYETRRLRVERQQFVPEDRDTVPLDGQVSDRQLQLKGIERAVVLHSAGSCEIAAQLACNGAQGAPATMANTAST